MWLCHHRYIKLKHKHFCLYWHLFHCLENYAESVQITTIVQSYSVDDYFNSNTAGFKTRTSIMTRPTLAMTDAQCEASSSPIPWVAGIIIGAVLSAVILGTVIVAVYLWRKKAQSLYKM